MSTVTSLFDANDLKTVNSLIQSGTCDVNVQDSGGYTPLHRAVQKGNIEIVRCLTVQTDCDVNIKCSRGYAPLHIAVKNGNIEIVRYLIENTDCDANIRGSLGHTPLQIAVDEGNIETIRYLIENTECDVNIQANNGYTPLHIAVTKGDIEMVRYLIEESKVNRINQDGYSLFFSTRYGLRTLYNIAKCQNLELFHVLIQHNVDVLTNHVDNQLQLVKLTLGENDFPSLWFVIQNGLYINCLTSSGENIIHLLAQFYMDYLYIDLRFLFDYGLDFNLINDGGNSPLMVASLLNNSPFIKFLAALPCDVKRQNPQGHTALHLCVIGFTLIKEKLNLKEIDFIVKMLCAHEYYPRYLACIDTLLNLGADVNIQDISGNTVLMLVCMKNDSKLLETLLDSGADVNIVDSHGRSALQYIDLTNNIYDLTCFNLLLSHGCRQSFNQPCLNGNTIIQNVLQFTPLWQIDDIVNFIKFLVFKNVNLQLLTSDDGEIFYGQLSLEEFSSESRHELREILYLSGGSFVQITQILHFEVEENYEALLPETLREKPREKFYLFANNLNLKGICRRVIRQNTGLAIHDRISELFNFQTLTDFLMFKDIDSERFSLPVQLDSCIYDDDYGSYDLNKEIEDYSMYKDCKYFNLNYQVYGHTPLHRAVQEGNITTVRCLIENTTCNVNIQDESGNTPLHTALQYGKIEIVKWLIQNFTCDINKQNSAGYAPLHIAVKGGEIKIIRCLIEHKTCNVNIKDSYGETPLHNALYSNGLEIVRCLLDRTECDVNIPDSDCNTPLNLALFESNIPIVCCMLKHTTFDVNKQDSDGYTSLHIAVKGGKVEIVKCLIENTTCYVDIQDSDGRTPLHLAVEDDYIEIVRCLLEHTTCNVNIQDSYGYTPLHLAVEEKSIEIVRYLIENITCNVNIQDTEGYTPLHTAVKWGNATIIEHTICDDGIRGLRTIQRPLQRGNIKIVRCFIETTTCNINTQDSEGYTPLHTAVKGGNVSILSCLIEHPNCNVNIQDSRGNTIIQNILKFPQIWQIENVVKFIKFLVFKNVNLQLLTSDNGESLYGQLSLDEFSSESRQELRQILYLSGASFVQITQILHFEVEENYEASLLVTLREDQREKFYLFANNLSLKEICRRVIRQITGLAIHDRFSKLLDIKIVQKFENLTNFLMFKDIDSEPFLQPDDDDIFQIQNHIPPFR